MKSPSQPLYCLDSLTLPIVDYHTHLSPKIIADNRPFDNLSELWIDGDHYKWRAMRIAGETDVSPLSLISPREKFLAFVRMLQKAPGNPLQAWSALEISETFEIDLPLTPDNAEIIWEQTTAALRLPENHPRALLARAGTELICTTDDPASSLDAHRIHAADPARCFTMLPTFRPDAVLCPGTPQQFCEWLNCLEQASSVDIHSFSSLLVALRQRFTEFHTLGCRVSDHGLEHTYIHSCSDTTAERIFEKLRLGQASAEDIESWRGRWMYEFASWDAEHRWTMLLHLGANRNINRKISARLGLDAGCDAIGDFPQGERLAAFLDNLDVTNQLPRTIIFNSNPRDTWMFATIAGSFFEEGQPGKVQLGPPWWFLDQHWGIDAYLDAVSAVSVLAVSPGMVADSRSFLSVHRHTYFRKKVLQRLQSDIERGIIDPERSDLPGLCHALFYGNAKSHFGWAKA